MIEKKKKANSDLSIFGFDSGQRNGAVSPLAATSWLSVCVCGNSLHWASELSLPELYAANVPEP